MASKEFIEKFKEFKKSLIETSILFDELYVSAGLKLIDLNENFVIILAHLSDAIVYTDKELKILEKNKE